jgi:hypothetical protein
MAVSQNGWPASPALPLVPVSAGGVRVTTAPAAAPLLGHVMSRFHASVEPLVAGWCWGFAYRDIRAASSLSNHSSGTAIDLNAPMHPLGKAGTFTPSQVAAIRVILAECGGLVRWGGDYSGRKDEMHFEVVGTAAQASAWRPPGTTAGSTSEGDGDMTPEQATQLAEVHWMLGQVKPQTDRLPALHSAVDLTQWGVNDGTSGTRALVGQVLANQGSVAGVDADALAAAIAAALDDDLAQRVADVLAARLAG